jgi:hypothetical protein
VRSRELDRGYADFRECVTLGSRVKGRKHGAFPAGSSDPPAMLYDCGTKDASAPAKDEGGTARGGRGGMHVLWPDYKGPVEKMTKRHTNLEAK